MTWDPDRYLQFADHRLRPGIELLARIPDLAPRRIVDLGCGTGHLTVAIASRWPEASIVGHDSSPEMIESATRDFPHLSWTQTEISSWEPDEPVDLIYSNATLHWLDAHEELFAKLRSFIAPDGVLAVQMPDNWWEPTHRIPAEVLEGFVWPDAAREALMEDRLSEPRHYAMWMQPAEVDLWRTTYFQQLTGPDPVWAWVTGSVLRPVLAQLDSEESERFSTECKRRYAEAYQPQPNGNTTLPFSRLFMVAQIP